MTPREECLAAIKQFQFRAPGTWWAVRIIERKKKGFSVPHVALQMAEEVLGYDKEETDL
jgi:hypothetical protein